MQDRLFTKQLSDICVHGCMSIEELLGGVSTGETDSEKDVKCLERKDSIQFRG
jgi:hypothetical protein